VTGGDGPEAKNTQHHFTSSTDTQVSAMMYRAPSKHAKYRYPFASATLVSAKGMVPQLSPFPPGVSSKGKALDHSLEPSVELKATKTCI
jgi:hypothetical protein